MIPATLAVDVFTKIESQALLEPINDICNPAWPTGFSSSGVYAFWHPTTNELLYVGLASDLALRFGQHLGFIECDPKCCKAFQISAFFKKEDHIGISLSLMSSNDQTCLASRRKHTTRQLILSEIEASRGAEARQTIEYFESVIIRSHKNLYGHRPRWNGNLASKIGIGAAKESLGA